jgi:LPS sulfotransferase NodH
VTPPLILLGVSRSGTTLLRVVLDRSPGLAIPDESFFVPLLARRHGKTAERGAFLDDVARVPTIRDWGLTPRDVAPFLGPRMPTGEAIAAIFEAYAAKAGKPRWGDKTPLYMRHLDLLERLFPDAQYVHLIRDGRDAALSFLDMPEGTFTRTWAHPTTPAQFACPWCKEIASARALGRDVGSSRYLEVRYEALVADPTATVAAICAWAKIPFEEAMLAYAGEVDVSAKPHQRRLLTPPTKGVRSWREEMSTAEVRAFEEIAGELLAELGYEVTNASPPRSVRAQTARASYDVRLAAWNASAVLLQRSPLWRRRHPRLA